MGRQGELPGLYDLREKVTREGQLLRLAAIEVAHRTKQGDGLAAAVGVDPAQFSRALYGRGAHFDLSWLPVLIRSDSERLLLSTAAGIVGCEVQPKRELTAEEKVDRLLRELRNSGAAGEAIVKRALGEEV